MFLGGETDGVGCVNDLILVLYIISVSIYISSVSLVICLFSYCSGILK